jgi:hypothetical protein
MHDQGAHCFRPKLRSCNKDRTRHASGMGRCSASITDCREMPVLWAEIRGEDLQVIDRLTRQSAIMGKVSPSKTISGLTGHCRSHVTAR